MKHRIVEAVESYNLNKKYIDIKKGNIITFGVYYDIG